MTYPRYVDLHCDTAYELYHQEQSILRNTLAISVEGVRHYPRYAQFFAVWSDCSLNDEQAYESFLAISDRFFAQLAEPDVRVHLRQVRTWNELCLAWEQSCSAALLAVEDARLLGGRIERLEVLAQRGVKYLTLLWGGSSCIGGSHDTQLGLTDFGRAVVRGCFELNIVPDISHASEQSAKEILSLAEHYGRPVIASHSNFFSVYPHTRNLRDEHFSRLCALGGVVGLNLCHYHLCDSANHIATEQDVIRHLDHALSLGGEHHIAIGGDLDGAPLPQGIHTVADVARLGEAIKRHVGTDDLIHSLFSDNALAFIQRNFV